jgi:hypothetical protein
MITTRVLESYPSVFVKLTGLRVAEYRAWLPAVEARYEAAEVKRLTARARQRGLGGGDKPALAGREQILLTVVWLRVYPTHDVLGFLFGVSQPTVGRYIGRVLPVLEQVGVEGLRQPDPGRKRRRSLPALLKDIPELQVIVDSVEQRVQRPVGQDASPAWYSGKQRAHTVKAQLAVEGDTGYLVHLSSSVSGRTADITLLKDSCLLQHVPEGMAVLGDAGYQGLATLHPQGHTPIKRNKGSPPLTEAQKAYNHAFARVRIVVETTLCRIRRYHCLSHSDRQHRCLANHHARLCAVAGLVNCQLDRTQRRRPC